MMKKSPESYRDELTAALRDLAGVLQAVQQRSQQWQGWRQLQLIDEQGVAPVAPYTPAALATLENAYALNENDGDLIHHLAIAYHAMAWDFELNQPDKSVEIWEKAFFYWRKLQLCEAFWQNLYTKGIALGKDFNKGKVEEFRRNLIQHLLEVHVDFIRYYYDLKRYDHASRHIELIKRVRIPLAARKKLADLVFEATTSAVPGLVVEGRFGEALSLLDGFFNLFPSYPTALQIYLEIARQWLEQISPSTQWQEIVDLAKRVLPKWEALDASEYLSENPLAKIVLDDLASILGSKYLSKARNIQLQREETAQKPAILECEEYHVYGQAISWFKKAISRTSDNVEIIFNLINTFISRAEFVTYVGLNSDNFETACQLLDQALLDCQEAIKIAPDQTAPHKVAAQILQFKAQYKLSHLPSGLSDSDFVIYLKSVEADLLRAIQFDPENSSVQEMLDKIRDN